MSAIKQVRYRVDRSQWSTDVIFVETTEIEFKGGIPHIIINNIAVRISDKVADGDSSGVVVS